MNTDERVWLVHSAEGSCGPYTTTEMTEYRRSGILNDDSYVWREGWPEWSALRDVTDLNPPSPSFAPAPSLPPLPTSEYPEKVRLLGAPVEDALHASSDVEEVDAMMFTVRQVRMGLVFFALAALIIAVGAVPRPWWEEPTLALTLVGMTPDDPSPQATAGEDDSPAPALSDPQTDK